MSRITGKDAANLIEAYNSLYAPQEEVELTEEQVQEDFENWVNSLVEEGHDLSEYTWEDMYEEYITEIGVNFGGQAAVDRVRAQAAQERQSQSRIDAMRAQRFGGVNPVVKAAKGGVQGTLDKTTGKFTPSAQQSGMYGRYAPPSMQQRTPAPARPTAPAPSARPAAQPTTAARPTPVATPAKPASTATIGFQLARQGVDLSKPSASPAVKPARPSLAAQAAELRQMQAASRQRQGLSQSFDIFDIVKGYLIDEGYAETEEAAAVIMANMSEEWRQSIVEGGINFSVPSRVDDFNTRRDELKNRYKQDVGPRIPGPGGGGQYGEPSAPKAMGVRLARGTSSSKRGVESKNNA